MLSAEAAVGVALAGSTGADAVVAADAATVPLAAELDAEACIHQSVGQQFLLQAGTTGQEDEWLELRDPTGPARWAWRRAHVHQGLEERGKTAGTRRALAKAHSLTLCCQAPGCAALVAMQAARRQARAAARATFAPGDGCGSRACSANFRPGQHKRNQRKMAAALEGGARTLVRWPSSLGATGVWKRPPWAAATAAARAIEAAERAGA